MIARTRLVSRVINNIYDEELRPLGLQSPQYTLLGSIIKLQPVTRAEVARVNHLDRSTLTRNLQPMLDAGWIEELADQAHGRSRPLRLTQAGEDLLFSATDAWRAGQARAATILGQAGMAAMTAAAAAILKV